MSNQTDKYVEKRKNNLEDHIRNTITVTPTSENYSKRKNLSSDETT